MRLLSRVQRFTTIFICLLLLTCAGCGMLSSKSKGDEETLPTPNIPVAPEKTSTLANSGTTDGSLWDEQASNFLFRDNKARRIGDLVTILIVESSSASNQATTDLGRESTFEAGVDNFWGLETTLIQGHNNDAVIPSTLMKASSKNEFKGSGATTRSDKLTSTMTAMVVEVMPNGNLIIEGNKLVKVNSDVQRMKLRGIIRPDDITSSNNILSTSIANAEISYHGRGGVLHDNQHPGWFVRIFSWLWPF